MDATMNSTAKSPQVVATRISLVATEIVGSIVQHPDQVAVDVLASSHDHALFLLKVHAEDMDILLAHEGRILRALRTFTDAMAAKNNLSIRLQIEATRPPPDSTLP
jgi:predicted RNA-binding protein YlqC (UPF0109 family)